MSERDTGADVDVFARLASVQLAADEALKAARAANDTAIENASATGALANRLALGLPLAGGNSSQSHLTINAGTAISWIALAFAIGLSFAFMTATFFLARDVTRIEQDGKATRAWTDIANKNVAEIKGRLDEKPPPEPEK